MSGEFKRGSILPLRGRTPWGELFKYFVAPLAAMFCFGFIVRGFFE